jgi:hypothetical protein
MPRGSAPGERRGGRKRGTPNKKTDMLARLDELAAMYVGAPAPSWLPANNWAAPLAQLCGWAAAEIRKHRPPLREKLVFTRQPAEGGRPAERADGTRIVGFNVYDFGFGEPIYARPGTLFVDTAIVGDGKVVLERIIRVGEDGTESVVLQQTYGR